MRKVRFITGAEIFLILSVVAIVIVTVLYYHAPWFADFIRQSGERLHSFALQQGYWGAFLITFFSNAALFIPIPYGSVLFILGSAGLHPLGLGLLAGLAAVLGEVVAYGVGRGAGSLVPQEYQSRFLRLNNLIIRRPRLIPVLIFLFGVTPLPDDIIIIPLGLIKYPFWKAVIPDGLGKLVMTTTMVYAGKYSVTAAQHWLGSSSGFWSSLIVVALTILIIYLTIKIKWDKFIK